MRRRPFAPALPLGLLAALAVAGRVVAAEAPQVGLGPFEGLYLELRPYVATGFVVLGLYVVLHRVGLGLLGLLRPAAPDAPVGRHQSPTALVILVVSVTAAVVLAVAILYVGLDVLNALLKFLSDAATESAAG